MKSQNITSDTHWERCPAPLCCDERSYQGRKNWKQEVIYYAGDPICSLHDMPGWKKKQLYVDRLFRKGEVERLKKEHLWNRALTVMDLMQL